VFGLVFGTRSYPDAHRHPFGYYFMAFQMIKEIITNTDQLAIASDEILEDTPRDLIQEIITDLVDTAEHHRGSKIGCAGLAASQIGYTWRIITIWNNVTWLTMINPVWQQRDDKQGLSHEGCLSRPGVNPKVKRYKRIRCTWFNQEGTEVQGKFAHFPARVIQHEVDHLDGIFINN
jgi:peptide deformylase